AARSHAGVQPGTGPAGHPAAAVAVSDSTAAGHAAGQPAADAGRGGRDLAYRADCLGQLQSASAAQEPAQGIRVVGKGVNPREAVAAGLEEMVLLYPGALKARSDAAGRVVPLLETSGDSGVVRWEDLVQRTQFGTVAINQNVKHTPEADRQALAVRVTGPVN